MKNFCILFSLLTSFSFYSQSNKFKKVNDDIKNVIKNEVKSDRYSLIDLRIDSINSIIVTEKEAVNQVMSSLIKKSDRVLKYISEEQKKANYLSSEEKFQQLDDLSNLLKMNNTKDKQLALLKRFGKADDKKDFLILTKAIYYLKLDDGYTDNIYTSTYFSDLKGNHIKDIYEFIILNQ